MRKTAILLLGLLAGGVLFGQNNPAPKEIIKKSREQSRLSGMEARTTLEISDGKGNLRVRETSMATRVFPDGTEKRSILFLAPPDVKGTGILIFDSENQEDNMWIYLPALRKSRKIVSSEKSKSFMGSEFSNADLAVENPDDFTYELEGTETVGTELCWKIRMTPANDRVAAENGISFKVSWISQKDYMPRKALFTDREGKPWKAMTYSGIKLMDAKTGKYFISEMEIQNLKNGRSSKMNMTNMSYNPSVREELFTLSYIEKQ